MSIHAFDLGRMVFYYNKLLLIVCALCFLSIISGDDEFDDFPDTESPGEIIIIIRPFFILFLISYLSFTIPLRI